MLGNTGIVVSVIMGISIFYSIGSIPEAEAGSISFCEPFCEWITITSDGNEPFVPGPGQEGGWDENISTVCDDDPFSGNSFSVPPIDDFGDVGVFNSGSNEFDWKPTFDVPSDAEWISTAADPHNGGTALYRETFFNPFAGGLWSAHLFFRMLIDNDLGGDSFGEGETNEGILVNCEQIPSTTISTNSKTFFQVDQFGGRFIDSFFQPTGIIQPGQNTLEINTINVLSPSPPNPSGVMYDIEVHLEGCPAGTELVPKFIGDDVSAQVSEELPFDCISKSSGGGDHEPATIGTLRGGQYIGAGCDIGIDGQCFAATSPYLMHLELIEMLTSPHTISNEIYCNEGYQECNHITVAFLEMDKFFPDTVMSVSADKSFDGTWSISWSDPQDFIRDPSDAVDPKEITFTSQIIDNKRVGTSFTIDFRDKDTGQLKIGFHVEDDENGFTNIYANEGVKFIDKYGYPYVQTEYDTPLVVEKLCLNEDPDYRYSCAFAKKRDLVTLNAEETLRQMMNSEYIYK